MAAYVLDYYAEMLDRQEPEWSTSVGASLGWMSATMPSRVGSLSLPRGAEWFPDPVGYEFALQDTGP